MTRNCRVHCITIGTDTKICQCLNNIVYKLYIIHTLFLIISIYLKCIILVNYLYIYTFILD